MNNRTIFQGDALDKLKELENNSIDLIVTDPPYGYSFMNKQWDKAIISVDIWKECLRVLKPGAWAFVMSAPRQDVLSHMIVNLTDAGFKTDFTCILWAYATGFPKAANISKLIDKRNGRDLQTYKELGKYLKSTRLELKIPQSEISKNFSSKTGGLTGCVSNWELGLNVPTISQWIILKEKLNLDNSFDELIEREEAHREIISQKEKLNAYSGVGYSSGIGNYEKTTIDETIPKTELAKKLDGSYAGFQPKPAVEVIIVCMKPLSEKNYTEQAMSNGKGVTWLDDCRIPYKNNNDLSDVDRVKTSHGQTSEIYGGGKGIPPLALHGNRQGRFPANILVSDNALDTGNITPPSRRPNRIGKEIGTLGNSHVYGKYKPVIYSSKDDYPDSGDFSRYFDVDAWEAQFIITPKPSKSEKNKGLDNFTEQKVNDGRKIDNDTAFQRGKIERKNTHPTVKPISLFKYLITMGSRENDLVLDPFMGSGTTAIAAEQIARDWIGIEKNPEYVEIFKARLDSYRKQNKMEAFLS